MTAILGVLRFDGAEPDPDMDRLEQGLTPYGRDGVDRWIASGVGLGRRLHRILPEDRFDRQPEQSPASRYVVVADVRLTERDDLVAQLDLGARADEMSDAAIVATALETWHDQAFERLYGAFAIAAWDKVEQRLLLARDHFGEKPLFYHHGGSFFAFASMPAGLHALPEIPKGADPDEIQRFLRLLTPTPTRSFFQSIGRVSPGHLAVVSKTGVEQKRYWQPDLTPLTWTRTEDYERALAEHLDRAVAAALRGAGGQVGAHLSAGFDSTAVAATAARQLAPKGGKIVAFTAVPREGYVPLDLRHRFGDEGDLAAATVAMHPNMDHVLVRPSTSPLTELDRVSSIYGVPQWNLCNQTWLEAIDDNARSRGLKIMIHGDMGNATISESGVIALPELFRAGRFLTWFKIGRGLVRNKWMKWQGVLWNTVAPWTPLGLWKWAEEVTGRRPVAISRYSPLKPELWAAKSREAALEGATAHPLDRVWDIEYDKPAKNSLTDRLTMMTGDFGSSYKGTLAVWGVDYRDPTADRRLVEFSLRVPVEFLIGEGQPRALLRKVLADRVPSVVLDNRKKGYQAADWYETLTRARAGIEDEIERIEMFEASEDLIDLPRLKQLLAEWPEAGLQKWGEEGVAADYRHSLLRAVSAASFMRKAAGSNY